MVSRIGCQESKGIKVINDGLQAVLLWVPSIQQSLNIAPQNLQVVSLTGSLDSFDDLSCCCLQKLWSFFQPHCVSAILISICLESLLISYFIYQSVSLGCSFVSDLPHNLMLLMTTYVISFSPQSRAAYSLRQMLFL